MSHLSPASLLVWAILSSLVGTFLVYHLWSFDRFKCLRWNKSAGTFKRIMTYSYLLTVPLITTYAIGFTAIKYYEGFVAFPFYGIIPKPIELWSPFTQSFNFPLMLCLSVGWSLEMVTHLEELCFWLFLVNSGTAQQNWFHSLYFKTWIVGSIVAVIYMPLITVLTRSDPLKSEAYTFLAGSLGSISLTLCFMPILFTFPSFLRNLRSEGVDTNTIVRLTKFAELNTIRVFFRFLFTVPFLILSVDGIRPHHHINENMLWTDFLAMIAGFGCSISSTLTLVIFFPRSIHGEIASRDERRHGKYCQTGAYEASLYDSGMRTNMAQHSAHTFNYGTLVLGSESFLLNSPPRPNVQLDVDSRSDKYPSPTTCAMHEARWTGSMDKDWPDKEQDTVASLSPLRPNRKKGGDSDLDSTNQSREAGMAELNTHIPNVNQMVQNFTSPIDLVYSGQKSEGTKLTFSKS
ncbi:hypothetical protein E4T56_gene16867 [Termitomyces sp. T112]|nr:hypothetical protein E4T56_gene16867 [Termitomyces sp. T112]KAH0588477.1 hypothetical protein H2248_004316 [Termitomyces sp. 'cryptogamus']